jgi:ComF family protein
MRSRVLAGASVLRAAVTATADLLWPQICPACACESDDASAGLCAACRLDLADLADEPACGACGKPVVSDDAPCPWCDGTGQGSIKRVHRLAPYAGPIPALVRAAKYAGRWELALGLGRLLADRCVPLPSEARLVPVPLHPRRRRERGYDQALLITRGLGTPTEALARVRPTQPQAALDAVATRRSNVRDAFVLLEPQAVRGRDVILVDDVLTTGATLRSAARALGSAGPASISAAVVAVVDPRRDEALDV